MQGLHAVTGCDTASIFAGSGKAKALKLLSARWRYILKLGWEWKFSQELGKQKHSLAFSPNCHQVELRYHREIQKDGGLVTYVVPPTHRPIGR